MQMISIIGDLLRNCGKGGRRYFPDSELFNETWLLRLVLYWSKKNGNAIPPESPFYFDTTSIWFSHAELTSPFLPISRPDPLGEKYTQVDGVNGDFHIGRNGKYDIDLHSSSDTFIVYEAKLNSPLAKGITNAPDYNQAARTLACMSMVLQQSGIDPARYPNMRLGYYLIVPKGYPYKTSLSYMDKNDIIRTVKLRVDEYLKNRPASNHILDWFYCSFLPMMDSIHVEVFYWEDIINNIFHVDGAFAHAFEGFYERCLFEYSPARRDFPAVIFSLQELLMKFKQGQITATDLSRKVGGAFGKSINLIPSNVYGPCCDTLVVLGFPPYYSGNDRACWALRAMCAHIKECPKTKEVFIVADSWEDGLCSEFKHCLTEAYEAGIIIHYLLIQEDHLVEKDIYSCLERLD